MRTAIARRLAAVSAMALVLLFGAALPAQAAPLTNVVWSLSKPNPSSTNVRYTWSFTTATTNTVASITFTVPAGTTGPTLTVVDYYGVGVGTATLNTGTNTVTYAVTAPASIASGVNVLVSIDGFVNTSTPGTTYTSTITTRTNVPGTIDTATTGNVAINNNTTLATVVVARATTFSNDTTGFTMLMDPSLPALADQTYAVHLAVATNSGTGYTLSVKIDHQLTGVVPANTFAAVSAGVATGVASGSFPVNKFGYAVTGTGVGTVQGAGLATGYVGYTTAGETVFSASGPTSNDAITITNRAKIGFQQSADTYTGTITYTVSPTY